MNGALRFWCFIFMLVAIIFGVPMLVIIELYPYSISLNACYQENGKTVIEFTITNNIKFSPITITNITVYVNGTRVANATFNPTTPYVIQDKLLVKAAIPYAVLHGHITIKARTSDGKIITLSFNINK